MRERTSAYSAITKNAFTATSTAAKMSFRPFTRAGRCVRAMREVGRRSGRLRVGAQLQDAPLFQPCDRRMSRMMVRRPRRPRPPGLTNAIAGAKSAKRPLGRTIACRISLRQSTVREAVLRLRWSASASSRIRVGASRRCHRARAADSVRRGPLASRRWSRWAAGILQSRHAHREPRSPCHGAAVRARSGRGGRRGHPRVRPSAAGARLPRVTRDVLPGGPERRRDRRGGALSAPSKARRSTSSTRTPCAHWSRI